MGRQGHFSNNEMDLKDIDVILNDCDIPKTVFFLNNYAILIGLNQTDNL